MPRKRVNVYSSGGKVYSENNAALTGDSREPQYENSCRFMFFSIHGITSDGGIYDLFQPCNEIISTMMQNSDKKVCLCDNTKIGKGGAFKICNVSDIDYIVCDRDISGAFTHPDTLSLIF